MIQPLYKYLIPEIMEGNSYPGTTWENASLWNTNIFNDLEKWQQKNNVFFSVVDWNWEVEDDIIDLVLETETDYKGFYGNFYITWDDAGKPQSLWFSGVDINDEEPGHFSWGL
jgi:hypothetical protein